MHKIHNNILPSYFLNLFTSNLSIHDHFTRQASTFHITSHHTNVRPYSIQAFGTNLWNSLSKDITDSPSLSVYKNDVLSLCIKSLKFEFIFSYYCNLCFSFFLFYFVLYIRYASFPLLIFSYYTFLLYTSTYTLTFSIVMYVILPLSCLFVQIS